MGGEGRECGWDGQEVGGRALPNPPRPVASGRVDLRLCLFVYIHIQTSPLPLSVGIACIPTSTPQKPYDLKWKPHDLKWKPYDLNWKLNDWKPYDLNWKPYDLN